MEATAENLRLEFRLNRVLIAFLAIVAVATLLRFYEIGSESYWLDEIIMVRLTTTDLSSLVNELQATGRPPVYVLLGYIWTQVFGSSEAATRSLSAVAGVASILVMYAVARKLFGQKVALLGCLIMSLAAFQIWYSQEFRYYSVLQLVTLCSLLFYIRALERGRILDFVLYSFFSVVAVYVHTYAIFLCAGLGLHFVLHWQLFKRLRRVWLLTQALICLGMLPPIIRTAAEMIQDQNEGLPSIWIPDTPLYAPFRTLVNFLFVERSYVSWSLIGLAALLLVAGSLVYVARTGRAQWLRSLRALVQNALQARWFADYRVTLLACWLLVPILVTFGLSILVAPMYLDRYVIMTAPAWYLAIALLIYSLRNVIPQALTLGVLTLLLVGALSTYFGTPAKEQWREAAAYLHANAEPNDSIAISYGGAGENNRINVSDSFHWYFGSTSNDCFVDAQGDRASIESQLIDCAAGNERIWLVLYADFRFDEQGWNRSAPGVETGLVTRLEEQAFLGTRVYLFDINSAPTTQ